MISYDFPMISADVPMISYDLPMIFRDAKTVFCCRPVDFQFAIDLVSGDPFGAGNPFRGCSEPHIATQPYKGSIRP